MLSEEVICCWTVALDDVGKLKKIRCIFEILHPDTPLLLVLLENHSLQYCCEKVIPMVSPR